MKHIKLLGLLAISAMALVAFAGTASASAAQFTAGQTGKALETSTLVQNVFTITGSEVKCATTEFTGTTEALASATQKVHPVYNNCEAFGFTEGVSVNTEGCQYTLNANGTVTVGSCTNGGIKITADPIFTTCTAVVENGAVLTSAVSYENSGTSHIDVTAHAKEIPTNVTQSSGLCPLTTGKHTGANGATYTGKVTVGAKETTLRFDP